jgi:LysR family transcriptional regulator, transcription activator of glutamate synthase operon
MELRELRTLMTLAELGSITRTGEKLHLSAAAIHKQLKVLEDELSVRLYEKAGRQLRLTQAAEILLPHVKNLLAQYDAALGALNEWKGLKSGSVRIGTGPTMSSYILPSLLGEFRRRFPEVELFVETGNTQHLLDCLDKGLLDLTFLVSSELLEDPGLLVEANWDFEFVLVSSAKGRLRRVPLADLQKSPFILYKKGSIFENLIDRYFVENRFRPRVIMRFDNPEAIKAMIRSRLGISMLPLWAVDADLKNKTLSLIRQYEPPLCAKIALVTRKLSHVPQPVAAFMEVARHWKWKHARLTSRRR